MADLRDYLTENEKTILNKVQQYLLCKSCQQALEDPVTLRCNHLLCRTCFETLGGLCDECGSVTRPKEVQRAVAVRNIVQAIDVFYRFQTESSQYEIHPNGEDEKESPSSFIETLPDSLDMSKFIIPPQLSQSQHSKHLEKESPISQILLSPSKKFKLGDNVSNDEMNNALADPLPAGSIKIVGRSQKRKLSDLNQENTFINDALEHSLFDHGVVSPTQSQLPVSNSPQHYLPSQQQSAIMEPAISVVKPQTLGHVTFDTSFQLPSPVPSSSSGANTTQLNISQPATASYSGALPTVTQSGSWMGAQGEIEDAKFEIEEFLNRVIQQRGQASDSSPPLVVEPTLISHSTISDEHKSDALIVVALYVHEKSKEMFEQCSHRGWITCEDSLISHRSDKKILITETTAEQNGLHLTARSVVYMKCVLLGFLIVDFNWLNESIAANKLLDPHNYEIGGSTQDTVLRTPQRSRFLQRDAQGRIDLLEGYSIYVLLPEEPLSIFYNLNDIEELVSLCKGNYLGCLNSTSVDEVDFDSTTVFLSMKLKVRNPHGKTSNGPGLVSVSWLFDVICHLRIPSSFDSYYVD